MRRCFSIDYPRREDKNADGVVVRVVSLKSVACGQVATLRSSIVWGDGTKQHTYTCDQHAGKLRSTTEDAGFVWDPQPYRPKN